jgi:hypothetical protein
MALNKNHQTHLDTMKAFEVADKNTPRDKLGRAAYGMGSSGMPRTPAQQESVKKAAAASAAARKGRGSPLSGRSPGATAAPGLGNPLKPARPGVSTGSLSLATPKPSAGGLATPKKGLLSL